MWAWWSALHALLLAAVALVAWPLSIKVLAAAAVVGHGVTRRPRGSPGIVIVAADGSCEVPEWHAGRLPLGARTLVCPLWIKLDVGTGKCRRDILLLADQLDAEQWRRFKAVLERRVATPRRGGSGGEAARRDLS